MIDSAALTEERINKVLTQYRESPKLLFLLRTYLRLSFEMFSEICDLPDKFDITTAVGDQLTILGKRLGFPRCHCVCEVQSVFGFECGGKSLGEYPVSGFCDENTTWVNCGEVGVGEVCINDDELYRKFLKVRLYQMQSKVDTESLETCLKILWGENATLLLSKLGMVTVSPGRELTDAEVSVYQVYPRVLPLALGVKVSFHFGVLNVFGFGEGFNGFCYSAIGTLTTEDNEDINGNNDQPIGLTLGESSDAAWLCQNYINLYDCQET